jgi:hypothetical protein
MNGTVNRRDFIRLLAAGSAGLVFGAQLDLLPHHAAAAASRMQLAAVPVSDTGFSPNLFLTITPADEVIITSPALRNGPGRAHRAGYVHS